MTIEFRTVTFGDVATIVGGGTPSTKDSENYGGGIPWITPKDLSTHHSRYIESGERSISAKGLSSSSAKLLPANSVLFTSRAPIGYVALARNEITTNQGFKSLVLKDGNIPEYFYYLLKHYTPRIESFASGSTFMEISGGALKGIEIRIPSIPMQKAIAHILGTLDDKIELNQKMNQTLEDIAKAIFKSWFVDFDPVRAKAEGRPTGLSPEISDLFPDELVNSEIGEIPKGWDRVQFTDTFEFFSGGTPKTSVPDYWDGEIPWFSIADLNTSSPWVTNTEKSITDLGLSKCSAKLIERGTTIITARGTVGKIALAGQDMAINQSCYAMRASEDRSFTWLYLQTLMLKG